MSLEKLRCPYCHKENNILRSIHKNSNSKTINWVKCDKCRKDFWYRLNGQVGKKEDR